VSTALDLATDCASAWRITHLVTADAFPPVAALRDKVMDFFGPDSSITYLVTCSYCVGIWTGAAVTAARLLTPRAWRPIALALTAAAAAPIIEATLTRIEG